jgi:hypothetical protein
MKLPSSSSFYRINPPLAAAACTVPLGRARYAAPRTHGPRSKVRADSRTLADVRTLADARTPMRARPPIPAIRHDPGPSVLWTAPLTVRHDRHKQAQHDHH